ncbi:phenolpthiocerol synthesis polyketide synthase ppsA [Amylocarpus encephaloides]|uniref:Phenolpthiocerol synthesis polyketide synthase ppsA n=1 Tax=Amylocarpus encephaloides TaxID=45428 RepID=A0A9P7YLA2_9HELO|nr:phenolpthiocerol synthesis polyketide synthase ppsA [Amylocarpus encephaloides]
MEAPDRGSINPEAIAVIGFGLKFPQQASTPAAFWDLLLRGRSARTQVPSDRYNAEAFYRYGDHGNGVKTGTIKTKHGHFIAESLDRFDAPFFSIAPHEAECMDPQQRWLLETTYHALENAGLTLDQVYGSNTSVYVGCFMNDHETMVHRDLEMPNTYHATGNASAMLANRISWFYNISGPSMSVNTACSGSLVALHLACQSLRTGETTMGLVCGSNLLFAPENASGLSNLNFLSPNGKCYAFDERANGYARGEGIACLIIKPVSAAIRDGDTIRALIRGTGVNSDGRTPGITQPSSEAQISLIRSTYSRFGLDTSRTRYFEAHGTGTALGDPLEAKAIATVFSRKQRGDSPLYVGALKSNIGHLEGASGLAGVIKAILVLEKAVIPPNIWFDRVNPEIREEWGLVFPTSEVPFPGEGLRRASVNSFGFGGTNAHAVLDDAESFLREHKLKGNFRSRAQNLPSHAVSTVQASKLLVWSAADAGGIARLRDGYRIHFLNKSNSQGKKDVEHLGNLAYTLSKHRSHLPWRVFAICDAARDIRSLEFSSVTRANLRLQVCFVFTGMGAQWLTMGKELLFYSVFLQSLEDSDSILREIGCQFSIIGIDTVKTSELDHPEFCQPICAALQIALVELLSHWNIKPVAVMGHSAGEVAAAFCAGIISKTHALKLAFFRGVAVAAASQLKPHRGGMMAVRLSPENCELMLSRLGSSHDVKPTTLQIACYNSPLNVTLSGENSELERLEPLLEVEGIMAKRLNIDVAYHNAQHMQTAARLYQSLIQESLCNNIDSDKSPTPKCFFISSVYGKVFEPDSDASKVFMPQYWVDNLVCPVRFTDAVQCAASLLNIKDAMLDTHFLEIGPHSTLKSATKEVLPKGWNVEQCYSSVLSRQQPAIHTAFTMAGKLHCLGINVNIEAINQLSPVPRHERASLDDLPPYPFDHSKRYWLESRTSQNNRFRRFPHNDFLGTPTSDWNLLEPQWNNRIILQEKPFIRDHEVAGACVYPAAGMLVMAIEAARQLDNDKRHTRGYRFRDVVFSKTVMVPESNQGVETQFRLRNNEELSNQFTTWYEFRLHMYEHGDWIQCCFGSVTVEYREPDFHSRQRATEEYKQTFGFCNLPVSNDDFYDHLRNSGLAYGPLFQTTGQMSFGEGNRGTADIEIQRGAGQGERSPHSPYLIHPAALDCIFQVAFAGITQGGRVEIPMLVPTGIKELWISADVSRRGHEDSIARVSAQAFPDGPRSYSVNYTSLWRQDENPFLTGNLTLTSIGNTNSAAKNMESLISLYQVDWKPDINLLSFGPKSPPFLLGKTDLGTPHQDVDRILLTEYVCYLAMSKVLDDVDNAISSSQLPVHLQRYLDWMRRQLSIMRASDSWNTFVFKQPNAPEYREKLFQRVDSFGPEGKVIVNLSRALQQIIRGKMNPLHILFADETLAEYYRFENPPPEVLTSIQKYVDCMAHANPDMKVLEIGAGTGGMTKGVLDIIGSSACASDEKEDERLRFSEYVFTDISPAFFQAATAKFGGVRFMCKTLNIEKDPKDQGFEMGYYDLIIASNVLHATRSLSSTLSNTRKLLKSGGKLVLVEGINPNLLRTSYIFGCLPGWWLSTESFREWGPLVPAERWDQLLKENGFTGTELVINGEDPLTTLSSLMVSTACNPYVDDQEIFSGFNLSIVRTESSKVQDSLALAIQEVGKISGLQISIINADCLQDTAGAICISLQTMDQFPLGDSQEKEYGALKKVLRNVRNLLWVTKRGSSGINTIEQEAILGLSRSIQSEIEDLRIITLGLEDPQDILKASQNIWKVLCQYFSVATGSQSQVHCEEIVEIDRTLCVSRLIPARKLEMEIQTIQSKDKSLGLEQDTTYGSITGDEEIEIEVICMSLRPRDVSKGPGQSHHSPSIEYAGIVVQLGGNVKDLFQVGGRVVAISNNRQGRFNSRVRCPAYLAREIAEGLAFEDVVAMPLDFITAYDALKNLARLQKGESILIQDGSSSLGQAAIQVAMLVGAETFVSTTEEDAKFLGDAYGIPISHILSFQSSNPTADIKRFTSGRGVHVVFNHVTGNDPRTSWDSVASCGRLIWIGSQDSHASRLGSLSLAQSFRKNVMFASVEPTEVFHDRARITELFSTVMHLITNKTFVVKRPLPVYTVSQFERSPRNKDSGTSLVDRIVMSFDPKRQDSIPIAPNSTLLHADATYVITGGLGGIGRSIARWMVSHGAHYLLLLSRQGSATAAAKPFLERLASSGITVLAPQCDISNEAILKEVFRDAVKRMPPIRGCIQASMVLKSAMYQNMSLSDWTTTLSSKVQGSLNLHNHLPSTVDFFILLSSVCGIYGASGQANYSFGCAYQDALARYRTTIGVDGKWKGAKTISIDLGIVEGVGYMAEHENIRSFMRSLGMQPISENYLHAMLEYYCSPALEIREVCEAQVVAGIMTENEMQRKGVVRPRFLKRNLWKALRRVEDTALSSPPGRSSTTSLASTIGEAEPTSSQKPRTKATVARAICHGLSKILSLSPADIDPGKPLHAFGVDSLVAMEMRSWFHDQLGADVSVLTVLSNISIENLAAKLTSKE